MRKTKRIRHYPVGAFTLLELIVVITIIGIITGVSVPYLGRSFRAFKIKAACRNLVSAVRFAQSEAVFTGIAHSLYFDLDNDMYYLVKHTCPGEDEEGVFLKVKIGNSSSRVLPEGVSFLQMEAASGITLEKETAKVRFSPDGVVKGGILWLTDLKERRLGVCIHQTGRAEVISYEERL